MRKKSVAKRLISDGLSNFSEQMVGLVTDLIKPEHVLQRHQKLRNQEECCKDTGHMKEDIQIATFDSDHADDSQKD
jgi:hypothetical protein